MLKTSIAAAALFIVAGCTKTNETQSSASDAPAVAAAGTAVEAAVASAPPPTPPVLTPPSGPSTQVGVYTAEQAARGKDVYSAACRSCHSPTSHTGQVFADWWENKPVSELYNFIMNNMPKNDPGTLAPQDAVDVVAYLFQMNAMPVGAAELYPETDSLTQYWINTKHAK